MESTYRQGESWQQSISLVLGGRPLEVGPPELVHARVHVIDVLLHCNGRQAAHYHWPQDPSRPERLPIKLDPERPDRIAVHISSQQSRRFEPGFLTAYVLVLLVDPAFPAGLAVELDVALGVVLQANQPNDTP